MRSPQMRISLDVEQLAEQLRLGIRRVRPLRPRRPSANPGHSLGAKPQFAVSHRAAGLAAAKIGRAQLGWDERGRPTTVCSGRVGLPVADTLGATPSRPAQVIHDAPRIAVRVDGLRRNRPEPGGGPAERLCVVSRPQCWKLLRRTGYRGDNIDQRQRDPGCDLSAVHGWIISPAPRGRDCRLRSRETRGPSESRR